MSFNKYLLSSYYEQSTILDMKDTAMNKLDQVPTLMEQSLQSRRVDRSYPCDFKCNNWDWGRQSPLREHSILYIPCGLRDPGTEKSLLVSEEGERKTKKRKGKQKREET